MPGSYSVSSGVGARWGSYHSGLDIPAAHGTPIHASCSGKVIRINTTCTHDYGKESSCGCGGGYGNYVIIDHGNEFITLLKDTSLITVIGGKEMVYAAQAIYGRTYEQMFPLIGIACIYLVLVMVFSWLQSLLERRLRQSDRR